MSGSGGFAQRLESLTGIARDMNYSRTDAKQIQLRIDLYTHLTLSFVQYANLLILLSGVDATFSG
jgi:hypothetical protein